MHIPISRAIQWAAENDESSELDVEEVAIKVTTLLIADLFGKEPGDIAQRIVTYRREYFKRWERRRGG